jgi:hypothetical protein
MARVTSVIAVLSGPKVDSARNDVMRKWLENTEADYLLMVDTDMIIGSRTIEDLLKHHKDIVGGLCFSGSTITGSVSPAIRYLEKTDEGTKVRVMWDYPTNTLVEADAIGAACMMISRECAEGVWEARGKDHPLPWFAHGVHNGIQIGEDIAFCLTARTLGYKVFVDTGLVIEHAKVGFIGESQYVLSMMDENHPNHEHLDKVPVYQELSHGNSG